VRATLFNSQVKNLIQSDANFNLFQDNTTRKAKGIELSGQWVVTDRITVGGSYTYTDAKNGPDTAARVPGHDIAANVDAQITAKANASLSVNHIMDYTDLVAGSVVDMPDYTVVNLSASYDVTDTLQGYVRVQNLMDSDYETITGYNTGGRQMFAGVRASF
jgi:vitamin B12 transporter